MNSFAALGDSDDEEVIVDKKPKVKAEKVVEAKKEEPKKTKEAEKPKVIV
jgi:hypothetical protein